MRGYRNIDRIYPTRPIAPSPHPFPLPDKPADFSELRYTAGASTFDINAFVAHNHIVGLLAIRDGNVVLERYAQGNTRDRRWYCFSVAKSVVSMLVGAAVKDGFIPSPDAPVSNFLPEGWMKTSTTPSVSNDRYGMLWWLRPGHAFAAVGSYGRAIYVNPPCRLVIVTHSVWPRATDPELSAHREGFFGEMAKWAAAGDGGCDVAR